MIDSSIWNCVRSGTCAVGYLTVRPQEFLKDPARPLFSIKGTGFLVRDTTAITNRHVIEALMEEQQKTGFPDEQLYLRFVYPTTNGLQEGYCRFGRFGIVTNQELDVGFIEFKRRLGAEFDQCRPLVLGDPPSIAVGQPIAVCGYPFGSEMLKRQEKTYRFGPVLQQGYISAIAPFDTYSRVEELLLDLRTAPGMSGSPVFLPNDGSVIGILHAGWDATTSLAVPIDAKWLRAALSLHKQGQSGSAEVEVSP